MGSSLDNPKHALTRGPRLLPAFSRPAQGAFDRLLCRAGRRGVRGHSSKTMAMSEPSSRGLACFLGREKAENRQGATELHPMRLILRFGEAEHLETSAVVKSGAANDESVQPPASRMISMPGRELR